MRKSIMATFLVAFAILYSLAPVFTHAGPRVQEPEDSTPPDIVLIVADDLGWGDLGCFGATDIQSPHLDGLAAEGQRWSRFYANCCVCSPTRASILSGCYPDRVGVPGVIRTHAENNWGKLAEGIPLLPHLLRQRGYRTAAIGKWHLGLEEGDHPLDRGFDFFHGFLGDMMDDYYTHLRHGRNYMRWNRTAINPAGHATSLFAEWAGDAIDRFASDPAPYFLYLAFNAPHGPIQPPPEALETVRRRLPELSAKRARLVALIEDLDAAIGRVRRHIESTGRETIIVFVSDNGGELGAGANNGQLRDGKGSMYEGGLRVPAIFHYPRRIPRHSTCTAVGATMDLLPTLCELAGVSPPTGIDGQSLVAWLQAPDKTQPPRELYFVRREGGPAFCGLTSEALRLGDWKLVHNRPTESFQLFELQSDPLEKNDLASSNPRKLREMQQRLSRHIQQGGRVAWQP
ncbi:MAG: arylsulfatase [Pirellulaceae bacterium]|nr:MAG: arylsulfatase [Pirellulaceae bacterium]